MEWTKAQYQKQRDVWVPWLEDMYLYYFTKDNKASYTTKENLDKTKVTTGNEQVDNIQSSINEEASGTLGQGGIAQPVGDAISKEGINRLERKGLDDEGKYFSSSVDIPGSRS